MKYLVNFLLLSFNLNYIFSCHSNPDEIFLNDKPIILSLGSQCEVTTKINKFGFRDSSFIFDWILSVDIYGIINVLNDNFNYFFDQNYFEIHPYMPWFLINTKYGFEYRHDWNESHNFWKNFNSYKITYESIKVRYDRRIERFKKLRKFKGKVFFLRAAFDSETCLIAKKMYNRNLFKITYQEAIELKNALKSYFPKLNFTLIIINYNEETEETLAFEDSDIIEFKFTKNKKDEGYENLFKIISDFTKTNTHLNSYIIEND